MKLPGWQASVSTAMPRKSPAIQGAPKMVAPAVQKFVPLNNPNDYLRLGQAEAGKYAARGKMITNATEAVLKIHEADQISRATAMGAQYSEELAEYTTAQVTDQTLYTEQKNEDGTVSKVYQWEDAQERLEAKIEDVQTRMKEETGFTSRRAQDILSKSFSATDKSSRTHVQKYVSDQHIARGQDNTLETLQKYEKSGCISCIQELANEARAQGIFNPGAMNRLEQASLQKASYTQTIKQFRNMNSVTDVSKVMDEVINGEGWGKHMTPNQRQQVVNKGNEQLTNIHLGRMTEKYEDGGVAEALLYYDSLANAGPEATGALDQRSHIQILGALNTGLNRISMADREMYVEQEGAATTNRYFNPVMTQEDQNGLAVDLGTGQTQNRKQIDAAVDPLARLPMEEFYTSPLVDLALRNGSLVQYHGKPLVTRLNNDILTGSLTAVDKVRQFEFNMPNAIPISAEARKKLQYLESQRSLGLYDGKDPVKMQTGFATIENRSESQKRIDEGTATALLKEHGVQESFTKAGEALGFTDDDWDFLWMGPDGVIPGSQAAITFEETYKETLPYVNGDHNRAARAGVEAVMTIHGATTAYGEDEPVTEYKSPEAMQPAPGFKRGQPNPYYDQQFNEHIADFNLNNGTEYDESTVKRVWAKKDENGVDYWGYVDLNGEMLTDTSGQAKLWPYERQPEAEAQQARTRSIDRQSELHIKDIENISALTDFEAFPFEDVAIDPMTGRISPSTPAASAMNRARWDTLTEEEKRFNNNLYMRTFVTFIKETTRNADLAGSPPAEQQMKIHLFLNSRGYMRGDIDGNFLLPPGGY